VDDGSSTKAGGDAPPLTLRLGSPDLPGTPGADQIYDYVGRVDDLSDGQVRIEPVWEPAGGGPDDWDQQVARLVVSGDVELGVIPARAWDTEGVSTLRALHAPFLVNSDGLLSRVVADVVADEMLAGLDDIGITGLALVPEGLRHIFSFGDPMLSPSDFIGATIRAPRSDTTFAVLEALGATPDDLGGSTAKRDEPYAIGVADGSIAAAESSFAQAATLPEYGPAAGNVAFFPKVNVIVANSEALDNLTAAQQTVLRDAALATRDWAIATNRNDAELAREYCRNGGRVVLASDADVAALHAATQVVYEGLEQDRDTAAMIARIRQLADDTGPPTDVEACGGDTAAVEPVATSSSETFPEGTYRKEITDQFLIDAGIDSMTASQHAGIWTMTFDNGQITNSDVNASTGDRSEEAGVYCVQDGRVSIGLLGQPPECGDFWTAGWTLEGDQLTFTDVQSHHGYDLLIDTLFGGRPFTRIE
jgi:TRAP-type C4-dicarboxylate transport system substrate-binding protein